MCMYGLQMRVAYNGLIFRKVIKYKITKDMNKIFFLKILRLSSHSMNSLSSGQITNLISNDASQIEFVLCFIHYLWVLIKKFFNEKKVLLFRLLR